MIANDGLPCLDFLLNADRGHDGYASFMYEFGAQMVGAQQWKLGLEQVGDFSQIVTTADEAFLIVAVLNLWNKVVAGSNKTKEEKEELYHKETYATRKDSKHGGVERVIGYYTEQVTKGASPDNEKKKSSNGKPSGRSWSVEGIVKYNELLEKVIKSRKDDPKTAEGKSRFDEKVYKIYMDKIKKQEENRKNNKRKRQPVEEDMHEPIYNTTDSGLVDSLLKEVKQNAIV